MRQLLRIVLAAIVLLVGAVLAFLVWADHCLTFFGDPVQLQCATDEVEAVLVLMAAVAGAVWVLVTKRLRKPRD